MRITVTADHIRMGHRADASACPLALAIREAGIPDARVAVGCVWRDGQRPYAEPLATLPDEASDFYYAFDVGKPVQPFSFDLDLPDPTCRDCGAALEPDSHGDLCPKCFHEETTP